MLKPVAQVSNVSGQSDADPQWRSAMALILSAPGRIAGEREVADFARMAVERNIDLNRLIFADEGGKIQWALLPMPTPGGTLQLLSPNVLLESSQIDPAGRLIESICRQYAARGGLLAQVLVEPAAAEVRSLYRLSGFIEMAELKYLQSPVRAGHTAPVLPNGYDFQSYSPQTHDNFASAIRESYEQSLDCPALSGMRDIDDVIRGHQAAGGDGAFDASLWRVLMRGEPGGGVPCGVLLLCRADADETIELVYIGLAPSVRRRGLGTLLVRQALAATAADRRKRLTLAVDSRNQPALHLYFRLGFQKIGAKIAMIRNLTASPSRPD